MKSKIGITDLKLIADVAYAHENGLPDHLPGIGFGAASKRLQRAGLIHEKLNGILPLVRLTPEGDLAISYLFETLEKRIRLASPSPIKRKRQ